MTPLITDLTASPIGPGTTPEYTAQLVDGTVLDGSGKPIGKAIPAAALTTLTLTIVDTVTKAVVNACQDVNILNTDRGAVDAAGNVTVTLLAADTALLVATHSLEYRSLVLIWTFNSGAGHGAHEVRFAIQALSGS